MRSLLWILLFLFGLTGILLPALYFYNAGRLPPLESDFDVERLLRGVVESERLSARAALAASDKAPVTWPRPQLEHIPHDLVGLYLSELGCPRFLQTPRESEGAAAWRAFNGYFFNRVLPGAVGNCEVRMAARIALDAGIFDRGPRAVATLRIRSFLTKDQLVAYALASAPFENGVLGVDDAAAVLFHRPAKELDLPQLAELALALPPNGYYADVKSCQNPALIRHARDAALTRAGNSDLLPMDRVHAAQQRPVVCNHR